MQYKFTFKILLFAPTIKACYERVHFDMAQKNTCINRF